MKTICSHAAIQQDGRADEKKDILVLLRLKEELEQSRSSGNDRARIHLQCVLVSVVNYY